ncbi:4430_t:CDS:2 [Scutellospora calospora]|uniref:4430_t:CDS:1 n=1 Tax=Scutellospora calospora TaxID=85575 RepID=A0ACA9JW05_9GLOM|nr:4430_t:CDS:2 [Scutellospora calospora]
MTLPLSINVIFDIEEEDIDISDSNDNELDNVLDRIFDTTDGKDPKLIISQLKNIQNGSKALRRRDLVIINMTAGHKLAQEKKINGQKDGIAIDMAHMKDQVQLLETKQQNTPLQNIQELRNGLVMKEDIYVIVYDAMKTCTYLNADEIKSLDKWKDKINPDIFMIDDADEEIKRRKLNYNSSTNIDQYKAAIWRDLWYLMKLEGWGDAEARKQVIETIDRWRKFNVETVNTLANYFEQIVLRDLEFSTFIDELKVGRMNPRRCQQRIREIAGTTQINLNDIYSVRSDIWVVHSITNDDVEYSVQRKDSMVKNNDNLDISSYICNCRNFKTRQLPCKHIFAILSRLHTNVDSIEKSSHDYSYFVQQSDNLIIEKHPNSFTSIEPLGDKNLELTKLQEELASIAEEWKEKRSHDICNL